jgi:Putative transposase/TrwC relaxase
MGCAWDTLRTFSQNHRQLQGSPGAVAVLHTHARKLDLHPHVHVAMPAAALDADKGLWRTLRKSPKGEGYLFNHKALAKVFRAKFLAAVAELGLQAPTGVPDEWVVDCKCVGNGQKTLVYLGRYLYRGVIAEKDILRCERGQVTYRWRDSKTKKQEQRTISGVEFLRLGVAACLAQELSAGTQLWFLHPNSKRLIAFLRLLVFKPCGKASTEQRQTTQTERPQAALSLLRRCHGNRTTAHLAIDRATRAVQRRGLCRQLNPSIHTSAPVPNGCCGLSSAKISTTRLMGPRSMPHLGRAPSQ